MTQQVGQLGSPKPFVKWAGGKRQLIPIINANIPLSFGTYFEPFLGGGAVLFHLLSARQSVACRVSDLNPDLVLAYVAIRDRVNAVVLFTQAPCKRVHVGSARVLLRRAQLRA